jgi:hypothetical protein
LAELKGNVLGLKDVAITVRHDSDLHAPLLVNMEQAEEDSEIPQRKVFTGRKPFDFWHSLIGLITSQPFIMAFKWQD